MRQAGHILLLDRDHRVRDTLTAALRRRGWDCHALGEVREAAEVLRREPPDVIIVDLGVAGYRALLAERVDRAHLLPVVIATGRPVLRTAVEALNVGAVAFLAKPLRTRELTQSVVAALDKARALHGIARARRMIVVWTEWLRLVDAALSSPGPAALPRELLDGISRRSYSPSPSSESGEWPTPARLLSPREREALFAFVSGLRPRQIARALGVTIHTARAHLKAVMRKMDVHSQSELLDRAQQPWLEDTHSAEGAAGRRMGRKQ